MRKRYIFYYNDKVVADWMATWEQAVFHAQGMVVGIMQFRKSPSISIYEVQEDGTEKLVRVQR